MIQQQVYFLFSIVVSLVLAANSATPPVEIIGNKFFFSDNGTQFLMRGIAYQQNTANATDVSFVDPLADEEACKRDVKYFIELETNVLRIYAINSSLDHSGCMKTFADAGIYIIADLSEPDLSINRDSPEWNLDLYQRYTDVVDEFVKYDNVLGFFAGNEVTNNKSNADASPYVKAAVRDVKKYISDKQYTKIPVGYSSNDDSETRVAIADYFACGSEDERADFFGINMYEWCGDSTFESSGYKDRTEEFKNLLIPIFFSEYGCNSERPRKFTEVGTLFSSEMTDVWSGGIVYMYFEEENDYGLVSVKGNSVSTLGDFSNYVKEIKSVTPSLAKASSGGSSSTLSCPGNSDSTWTAATNLPPTPEKDVCDCLAGTLTCQVDSSVSKKDYGDLFGIVCGKIDCSDISGNGTTGVYGAFSFCSDKDKLSYVLNKYYEENDKAKSACAFDGSATLMSSASSGGSCQTKLSSAMSAASESAPKTTGGSSASGSSSSGSSSSGSSTSTKKSGGNVTVKALSTAEMFAIVTIITSFVGGASLLFV
ncbi:1,3-beta-glucanosyltransferase gas1 [Scheffersomyces spartinae]|uniref:1,3-beta-glucanosyltransferase n=1 Tax=Scheffersomyces spartinae TaxID=45513 RepID=A0A9P7V553_9ASCO|nr:1,3-beta-glucanosyltransferase gas1 [Scheffersomyces spartinae]KAG7191557.1 1,3-beta-glucanosyltransferase gas1 [Scheffersomyces spartinae]